MKPGDFFQLHQTRLTFQFFDNVKQKESTTEDQHDLPWPVL